MHKCEDERHEYQIHLEGLARTIAVLEPLAQRIEELGADERAALRLRSDFGGRCPRIYERTLRKVYGRDAGAQVLQELQECPAAAVPVVLARLRQKNDEWRRAQREWEPTWRTVDARHFYKSLDTAGLNFKASDKKHITAKAFVGEVEGARRERLAGGKGKGKGKAREASKEEERDADAPGARAGLGYQLQYALPDEGVLADALRLVYAYLDHAQGAYAPAERRAIERFLRAFVPALCVLEPGAFNAACGPADDDGSSEDGGGDAADGAGVDDAEGAREWVRECVGPAGRADREAPVVPRPFFCNTTFYTLLRLLQVRGTFCVRGADDGADTHSCCTAASRRARRRARRTRATASRHCTRTPSRARSGLTNRRAARRRCARCSRAAAARAGTLCTDTCSTRATSCLRVSSSRARSRSTCAGSSGPRCVLRLYGVCVGWAERATGVPDVHRRQGRRGAHQAGADGRRGWQVPGAVGAAARAARGARACTHTARDHALPPARGAPRRRGR
jgi:hypothetical protein